MTNDRLRYLLELFYEKKLSDAESAELNNWYEQQQLMNNDMVRREEEPQFISHMSTDFMTRLSGHLEMPDPVRKFRPFHWVAAASVIAIASMLVLKMANSDHNTSQAVTEAGNSSHHITKIINASPQDTSFYLPDSSLVILYTGSAIQLKEDYGRQTRTIELESGSGYFKVKKNKQVPFIVVNQEVSTTALGTAFTVHAGIQGQVNITLHEGEVMVSEGSGRFEPIYLLAGEEISISMANNLAKKKKTIHQTKVTTATNKRNPAHLKEELIFKQDSLSLVLRKLASYYNIEIGFDQLLLSQSDFSGRIRPSDKPAAILDKIALLNDLEVVETKQGFLLKKN